MSEVDASRPLIAVLPDVANILAYTSEAERRLRRVLSLTRRALGGERAALWDGSESLPAPLVSDPEVAPLERAALEGSLRAVVARFPSAHSAERGFAPEEPLAPEPEGQLTLPITGGGAALGALRIAGRSAPPTDAEVAFLAAVTAQIGAYLQLVRLNHTRGEGIEDRAIARSPPRARDAGATGAREDYRFFAEVGAILSSSLDAGETLASVGAAALRAIADICLIYLTPRVGAGSSPSLALAEKASADPEHASAIRDVESALGTAAPPIARTAMERGQPVVMDTVPDSYLEAHAEEGTDGLAALRAIAPTSVMALPLKAHGDVLGVLLCASTRGERRYGERERWLGEELARRAASALANAWLYREARDALLARDRMLGIVAHDLRSPLGTIRLSAEMLRGALAAKAAEGPEPPNARRLVDAILRATARGERLIRDLIDVHRLEAGALSLECDAIAIAPWLGEFVADFRDAAARAEIDLRAEISAVPDVWGDRERLAQALGNLVSNALRFTPAGGRVTIGARPEDERVLLWVRDSGVGIAPEHMPHLFEPYYRADARETTGAGLGLSICKGIVEAHAGSVWAESDVERGSIFYVSLPAAEAARPAREESGPAAP